MAKIEKVSSQEILDSRGIPTLETTIYLDDGSKGSAAVPSGASVGTNEAFELRDADPSRYGGQGVLKAIENVQGPIFRALKGANAADQLQIDQIMRDLDGTENKSRLGANAILSVSLASAVAAAASRKVPLYRYLRGLVDSSDNDYQVPTPMVNLLEGGRHLGQGLAFQEFLVIIKSQKPIREKLVDLKKIINCLADLLRKKSLGTGLGMEGGFSPNLRENEEAIKILEEAVENAYFPRGERSIGLDLASTTFSKNGQYEIGDIKNPLAEEEFIDFLGKLSKKYNLFSLEDPIGENDWEGWRNLYNKLGGEVLIIGDDLTTTNLRRLEKAIREKVISGVIIKPNQVGTLTETIEFVRKAKGAGLKTVVSHRSGETKDTFISDLAVAARADFIKIGSPAQKERLTKYQRLIEIEKESDKKAT